MAHRHAMFGPFTLRQEEEGGGWSRIFLFQNGRSVLVRTLGYPEGETTAEVTVLTPADLIRLGKGESLEARSKTMSEEGLMRALSEVSWRSVCDGWLPDLHLVEQNASLPIFLVHPAWTGPTRKFPGIKETPDALKPFGLQSTHPKHLLYDPDGELVKRLRGEYGSGDRVSFSYEYATRNPDPLAKENYQASDMVVFVQQVEGAPFVVTMTRKPFPGAPSPHNIGEGTLDHVLSAHGSDSVVTGSKFAQGWLEKRRDEAYVTVTMSDQEKGLLAVLGSAAKNLVEQPVQNGPAVVTMTMAQEGDSVGGDSLRPVSDIERQLQASLDELLERGIVRQIGEEEPRRAGCLVVPAGDVADSLGLVPTREVTFVAFGPSLNAGKLPPFLQETAFMWGAVKNVLNLSPEEMAGGRFVVAAYPGQSAPPVPGDRAMLSRNNASEIEASRRFWGTRAFVTTGKTGSPPLPQLAP